MAKPAGTSGYTQTSVTLNGYGLTERTRTSPTGKTSVRFSVAIEATPTRYDLNPKELGRGPAIAMQDHLRHRIRTIQASAAESTQDRRKAARLAYDRGEAWALARYAGGRLPPTRPASIDDGDRLFNDSGRLANGLIAQPVGDTGRVGNRNEWVLNVAANRLDPRTLTGPDASRRGLAALQEIHHRLVELIPEFGDPRALLAVPSVRAAIEAAAESVLQKNIALRAADRAAKLKTFLSAVDLFTGGLASDVAGLAG